MPPQINSQADAQHFSESINDQHGTISSSDNTCLFYRYWPAAAKASSERAVVVLYGIGYQSGPYKVIADAMNPSGIDVYALDARGHRLSCGRRGFIGTPTRVAEDVSSMIQFVKKEQPAARIYLLGESMGGAFALNYVKERGDQITGLILLAPAINVNRHQLFKIGNLALLPYFLFAHRSLAISLVDKRLEESSRDPKFILERRADPLAYKKVSFGYLWDIQHLVKNWESEIAPHVNTPTLIIQGGKDLIVNRNDCEVFVRKEGAADKQYKAFRDTRHTTLWDPATPEILRFMTKWVLEH